jgi:hypothetical protein
VAIFGKIRAQDTIQTRFDVVHESHNYTEAYKRIHGQQASPGHGRWCELDRPRTSFPKAAGLKAPTQPPGSSRGGWPGMTAPGSEKGR